MTCICEDYKTKILEAAEENGWDYIWDKTRSCMTTVVDTLRDEVRENNDKKSKSYIAFRRCFYVPHWFYFIYDPSEAISILKSEVSN